MSAGFARLIGASAISRGMQLIEGAAKCRHIDGAPISVYGNWGQVLRTQPSPQPAEGTWGGPQVFCARQFAACGKGSGQNAQWGACPARLERSPLHALAWGIRIFPVSGKYEPKSKPDLSAQLARSKIWIGRSAKRSCRAKSSTLREAEGRKTCPFLTCPKVSYADGAARFPAAQGSMSADLSRDCL